MFSIPSLSVLFFENEFNCDVCHGVACPSVFWSCWTTYRTQTREKKKGEDAEHLCKYRNERISHSDCWSKPKCRHNVQSIINFLPFVHLTAPHLLFQNHFWSLLPQLLWTYVGYGQFSHRLSLLLPSIIFIQRHQTFVGSTRLKSDFRWCAAFPCWS